MRTDLISNAAMIISTGDIFQLAGSVPAFLQARYFLPSGIFNLNNWAVNWQGSRPYWTLGAISVNNGVLTTSPYVSGAVNYSVVTGTATLLGPIALSTRPVG
jgi:hypothetical protein